MAGNEQNAKEGQESRCPVVAEVTIRLVGYALPSSVRVVDMSGATTSLRDPVLLVP